MTKRADIVAVLTMELPDVPSGKIEQIADKLSARQRADMAKINSALDSAQSFISGFSDDPIQEGIGKMQEEIEAAMELSKAA